MGEKQEVELSPQGIPVSNVIPLHGQVKMLADHMARSHATYAALTSMGEVDATDFEAYRREIVPRVEEAKGIHISFTHIMVKVLAQCLKQYPIVNSTLVGDKILLLSEINIGVATALESGMLIVPVIKHADKKSVVEIAQEGRQVTERARKNRLTLEDVTGGTFTLTNAGMFRHKSATSTGTWSTPIITMPQSAILGLGGLYQKPVVSEGEICVRTMLPTSFTIDHRVINGVPAIQFMNTFAEHIEKPETIDLGL